MSRRRSSFPSHNPLPSAWGGEKSDVKDKEPIFRLRLQNVELNQILEILRRHAQNCAGFSKFELNRLHIANLNTSEIFASTQKNLPSVPNRPNLTFAPDIRNREYPLAGNLKCEEPMQNTFPSERPPCRRVLAHCQRWVLPSLVLLGAMPVYAQTGRDPWDNAVNVLKTTSAGTIATGL